MTVKCLLSRDLSIRDALQREGLPWGLFDWTLPGLGISQNDGAHIVVNRADAEKSGVVPALMKNQAPGLTLIGITDLSIDSFLAVAALAGEKPDDQAHHNFFAGLAHAEKYGRHTLNQTVTSSDTRVKLAALFDYDYNMIADRQRDTNQVTDRSNQYRQFMDMLNRLLKGDQQLMQRGSQWLNDAEIINSCSFMYTAGNGADQAMHNNSGDVVVRTCNNVRAREAFMTPAARGNRETRACVLYNTMNGHISLDFTQPIPGISARNILTEIFDGSRVTGDDQHAEQHSDPTLRPTAGSLSVVVGRVAALLNERPAQQAGNAGN